MTADTRAREAFEALHPKVVFDWEDGYPIPRGVFPHDCYFDKWDGFALATAAEREQRDGEPLIDYKLRTDDDYRRKFINELHKQVDAERERTAATERALRVAIAEQGKQFKLRTAERERMEALGDAAADVIEQMLKGHWVDDHGHDVSLNMAMLDLKNALRIAALRTDEGDAT